MKYSVILYYNFYPIQDPDVFCVTHKNVCRDLELKGRVYVSHEGINGTLSGLKDDIAAYKNYLHSIQGFGQTEFKEDLIDFIPFDKLIVKVRPEIVTLKSSRQLDPYHHPGRHLSPQEWRTVLESGEEYQLIDVRNNYESAIGHFEGAIKPDVKNFYDFEDWVDGAHLDKDKKVLMYCTGGIRCEKFSLLMEEKGFKDVYQLQGGIINYAKQQGDAHYKGKCFVFDDRLAVPIEKKQKEPLGRCEITGTPCDDYMNCHNMDCNKLFICSEEAAIEMQGCCCEDCLRAPKKRPFDRDHIYAPSRKWYQYYSEDQWEELKQG
ncbi:MAG: rhodanese-related sulfurtransferase [Candidatus Omnitrophica bacterium]|nr:rhodanese-related sulfurtransferase [Candidatus Omnitrophota bacterium]